RTSTAHAEGGKREYSILTKKLTGENGVLKKLHGIHLEWTKDSTGKTNFKEIPGSEFTWDVDLLFIAMGFVGPEKNPLLNMLDVALDARGNVKTDDKKMTSVAGIFAAGDMRRGQSLIVWAIAEGRQCAKAIDEYLMGTSELA
ncbi:MAG: Glutamate synthase [NADPH] small chain, (NADPH-GOGAT), partial [uncultured bacterium]